MGIDKYMDNYLNEVVSFDNLEIDNAIMESDELCDYYKEEADAAIEVLDKKIKDQRKKIIALIGLCTVLIVIAVKILNSDKTDKKKKSLITNLINKVTGKKKLLNELKKRNQVILKYRSSMSKMTEENNKLKAENEKLKKRVMANNAEKAEIKAVADKVSGYVSASKKNEALKNNTKVAKEKGNISSSDYQEAVKKYKAVEKELVDSKTDILKAASELKANGGEYSKSIANALGKCMKEL